MSAYGHQKDIAFSKELANKPKHQIIIDDLSKNSWKEDEQLKHYTSLGNREVRS